MFPELQMTVLDYMILEFSQEPGFLSLSSSARSRLNISTVKIYIGKKLLQGVVTCMYVRR